MANYFDTGIQLTAGFSLSGQAPLDGRTVVENLSDLDNHIVENRCYEGMEVYVLEDKKKYIYNGTTFEEFVSGGNGNVDLTDIENRITTLEENQLDVDITTTITNNSTDTQIPTAKTVATVHNGKNLTEGVDVLRQPVGRYNISTNAIAQACTNLPSPNAGILTIRSIRGNVPGVIPHLSLYHYHIFEYIDINGDLYICNVNSSGSSIDDLVVSVRGWYKIPTSKDLDLTTVENRLTTLEENANDLFQSVSDGKTLVANAITDKGVSTSSTDTFATMASNIRNINTATVGYNSEKKSGSVTVDTGYTAEIRITFSNTVLGVTMVDYSWSSSHLDYRGFSVSGNTVTVKIKVSSTYDYSTCTVFCTVNANILA